MERQNDLSSKKNRVKQRTMQDNWYEEDDVKESIRIILERIDMLQMDCATLETCKKEDVEKIIKEEVGKGLIPDTLCRGITKSEGGKA